MSDASNKLSGERTSIIPADDKVSADTIAVLLARALICEPTLFDAGTIARAELNGVVDCHRGKEYGVSPVAEDLVRAMLMGFYAHDGRTGRRTTSSCFPPELCGFIARQVARTMDEDEIAQGRLKSLWAELNNEHL